MKCPHNCPRTTRSLILNAEFVQVNCGAAYRNRTDDLFITSSILHSPVVSRSVQTAGQRLANGSPGTTRELLGLSPLLCPREGISR
jgi:hypothetical protein